MENNIVLFHGGCHGCTQQLEQKEGTEFCRKCQYFQADWELPDLNNSPPTDAELERQRIKEKYNI